MKIFETNKITRQQKNTKQIPETNHKTSNIPNSKNHQNLKIEKNPRHKKTCQLLIYINVSKYNGSKNENYPFGNVLLNMFETMFLNVFGKKKYENDK